MAATDTYSQPDAADPILESHVVVELVRRHVPSPVNAPVVDESGGEARAYLVDDVVLKVQRPHRLRPRTSLQKEARILEHLARHSTVPVPRVLGYGREGDVEYEVLSRVPGISLHDAALGATERRSVLHALGVTLRDIHDVDQRDLVESGLVPGDQSAYDLASRLENAFDSAVAPLLRETSFERAIDFKLLRSRCLVGNDNDVTPLTLHSNPGSEHCFIDPTTKTFTGLIDFGDAYRSHPALDVRSWRSLEDSQLLLEGYASRGPLDEQFLHVWRAGVALNQLRLGARHDAVANTVASRLNELFAL